MTPYAAREKSRTHSSFKKKGDKKNVVKNFVKAFISEVQLGRLDHFISLRMMDLAQNQIKRNRDKVLKFAESKLYYNNYLIRYLIGQFEYSEIFRYFLQNRASAWLDNSQVTDKSSHRQVLQQYIEVAEKPQKLDQIIVLKYKN